MKFCPQCGNTFEPGARFCQECGFDANPVEPATSDASETHPEKPENGVVSPDDQIKTPSEPPASLCPKCSTRLEVEDRFCPGCGFDTQQPETKPAEEEPTDKPLSTDDVVLPPAAMFETTTPEPPKPTCPKCGTDLEPGERFCPGCGFNTQSVETEPVEEEPKDKPLLTDGRVAPPAAIPETPAPDLTQPTCPKCDTGLEAEDRFCPGCGFDTQQVVVKAEVEEDSVDEPLIPEEVVVPPVVLPETPAPELTKATCPKCGTALEAEERFCPGCGFDTKQAEDEPVAKEAPTEETLVTDNVVIPPVILPETPEKEVLPIDGEKSEAEAGQFCPECGAEISEDDDFCQECGYKTGGAGTATAAEKPDASNPLPSVVPPAKAAVPPVVPPPVQPKDIAESLPPKKKKKLLLVIMLILLSIGVLGGGGYFVYKKFFLNSEKPETSVAITEEDTTVSDLEEEIQQMDTLIGKELDEINPESKEKAVPPKTNPKKKKAAPKVIQPEKKAPAEPKVPATEVITEEIVKRQPRSLYNNYNTDEVNNDPKSTNRIKFKNPTMVTRIITFHHNDGKGAIAGTISLEGRKDKTEGPWQARNAPGSDGTANGKWICEPNIRIEAGTYKLILSDEKSWSYNSKSNRKGMVIVEGYTIY